jgi:signal transduction histidine kinase/CheY-like chemotaxis protein
LALGLTLVYVLLGGSWIVFSDAWLGALITDPRSLTAAQTVKGWFYVGLSGILVYGLIVTGLRNVERKERDFRTMFALSGTAHAIADSEGRIIWANPALATAVGRDAGDLIGDHTAADSIWPDIDNVIRVCPLEPVDADLRTAEGNLREGVMTIAQFPDDRVALAWTDLSAQRAIEQRLSAAARLDSLGAIAAGVAHDFNGVLAVVRGFADEVHTLLPEGAEARALCDEIGRAVERGGRLTAQILDAAKGAEAPPTVVDAGPVFASLREAIRRVLGSTVSLEFAEITVPLPVRVDVAPLEQILLNLVRNARAAMPEGGSLAIAAGAAIDSAGRAVMELVVRDTGVGMTSEEAAVAFEPFYSRSNGGSGLGLAIVRSVCDRAGGDVRIESEPGRGTIVRVQLPLVAREADVAAAPVPHPHGGQVLLVDDDPAMQRLISRVLGRLGYTTMTADSLTTAEAIVRAAGASIDFIVTDVHLPDGSGLDFALRLHESATCPPLLIASGFLDETMVERIAGMQRAAALRKPFQISDLEAALAKLATRADRPAVR